MVRPESWSRLTGESPVRVGTGAPGSRPRFVAERRRAERGVESLFGGSKRAGWNCSLVTATIEKPSRSFHGEGQVRHVRSGIGVAGSRGVWGLARAHGLVAGRGRPVCAALSAKTARISRSVKSSGAQRESDGVVVVLSGVKLKAPGAKDPGFGRGCGGGKR
jgi:hypothetical protein